MGFIFEKQVIAVVMDQLKITEKDCIFDANFEALGANEGDILNMLKAIENEFDIEITNDELKNIHTIRDIVDHIVDCLVENPRRLY